MLRIPISVIILLLSFGEAIALERYELKCDSKLAEVSLDSALSQAGVKEKSGKNDGPQVEAYLKSVGLGKGYPYCAAGQYWAFSRGAYALKLSGNAIPIKKSASTMTQWADAKRRGYKTKAEPKRGDLIYWQKMGLWQGHVERIYSVRKAGWVRTIGFNTSSGRGDQREGGGVFKRQRNIYHFLSRMAVRGFVGFRQ